jgi:hypothetical protein
MATSRKSYLPGEVDRRQAQSVTDLTNRLHNRWDVTPIRDTDIAKKPANG